MQNAAIRFTPTESTVKMFWERVDKKGKHPSHCPDLDDCWIWTGHITKGGYGQIRVGKRLLGVRKRAHRLSWIIHFGEIPDGILVCHKCDNPPCVNPNHLFLGTAQQNKDDCCAKGRQAKGDRQGLRLHPEKVRRGEFHASAKIKDADVVEIRKQFAAGNSQQSIADKFGINQTNVGFIVRRHTWRHIL